MAKLKRMAKKIKMANKRSPSPTLSTIRMVEDALKNMDNSCIKMSQLKKILPRQVNHNTLIEIIDYLDKSGKILYGIKGITWIYNPSKKLKKAIENSWEWTPEGLRKFKGKVY